MIEHCQACEGIVAAECGDGFDPCPGLDVPQLRVLPPRIPHIPDQCDHTMREREFATVDRLGCPACAVAELARLRVENTRLAAEWQQCYDRSLRARDEAATELGSEVRAFLDENKEWAETRGYKELEACLKHFEEAGKGKP